MFDIENLDDLEAAVNEEVETDLDGAEETGDESADVVDKTNDLVNGVMDK